MFVGALVVVALVVTVLAFLGHIPLLLALPALGLVVAVVAGFLMRRSGPGT